MNRQRQEFHGISLKKDKSIRKYRDKKKKLVAEVERLRSSLSRLRADRTRVKSLAADSDNRIKVLIKENDAIKRELAEARQHETRVAKLSSEKASLQERVDVLSSEATTLRKSHREALRRIQSETYRASRLETQQRVKLESAIETEQAEKQSESQAGQAVFEQLSQRALKAEADLSSLEEERDAAFKSFEFQKAELRIQLNVSSRRATEAEDAMNIYRCKLETTEVTNAKLNGESNIVLLLYTHESLTDRIVASGEITDLNARYEELNQQKTKVSQELHASFPIHEIKRQRSGRTGGRRWSHVMWELLMEQLVNGTPPAAVNKNIVSHIRRFSPKCVITELPSIWTIHRARSVLLTIVQTLSAYRLGHAHKWGQIFTDGTSRRQQSFQNLLISIEEDELYK